MSPYRVRMRHATVRVTIFTDYIALTTLLFMPHIALMCRTIGNCFRYLLRSLSHYAYSRAQIQMVFFVKARDVLERALAMRYATRPSGLHRWLWHDTAIRQHRITLPRHHRISDSGCGRCRNTERKHFSQRTSIGDTAFLKA